MKALIKQILLKLISCQHKLLPMPLGMFRFLYSFRFIKTNFAFYGNGVFLSTYSVPGRDNLSYWLSQESLYWHFWRQTDVDTTELQEVLAIPEVRILLADKSLTAVELGFGVGKNYGTLLRRNRLKKYVAVEANRYLCNFTAHKFRNECNLFIINQTIKDFVQGDFKFDILICAGGVLMYLDKETIDVLFDSLPRRGVQAVMILNEGTALDDIIRQDNTTMYNFRKRLSLYNDSKFFIERVKEKDIYQYFVMC